MTDPANLAFSTPDRSASTQRYDGWPAQAGAELSETSRQGQVMSPSEDPPLLPPTLQPFRDWLVVTLDALDQVLEHPRFIDAMELRASGLPGKPAGDIHNIAHRERFSNRTLPDKPVEAFPLTHDPLTGEPI